MQRVFVLPSLLSRGAEKHKGTLKNTQKHVQEPPPGRTHLPAPYQVLNQIIPVLPPLVCIFYVFFLGSFSWQFLS